VNNSIIRIDTSNREKQTIRAAGCLVARGENGGGLDDFSRQVQYAPEMG
jgi:hypothetical protein